jgi:hypothetical protein
VQEALAAQLLAQQRMVDTIDLCQITFKVGNHACDVW